MKYEFNITGNAAKRLNYLISSKYDSTYSFRVAVHGGGCSGFSYEYTFDNNKSDSDLVFQKDGATVLIDEMSIEFLNHSELDFIETLGSAAFEIKNPNAASKCGCGNSFAI